MRKSNKICIVGLGGGGFHGESELIVSRLDVPPELVLIYSGPKGGIKEWRTQGRITAEYVVESPTLIGTSTLSSVSRLIKNFFAALLIIKKEQIALVIGVGTSQIIPFGAAARLLGRKVLFVESITRVNQPSATQRLVKKFRLANHLYDFSNAVKGESDD